MPSIDAAQMPSPTLMLHNAINMILGESTHMVWVCVQTSDEPVPQLDALLLRVAAWGAHTPDVLQLV